MFASIDDVISAVRRSSSYICNRRIATVVYLATQLEKPILIEGPAGVGKTELAKVVAAALGLQPDPPAVLRGPRRGQGAVRVGVRQAAALHADPQGQDQRGDRRRGVAARGGRSHRQRRTTSSSPIASSCRGRCCARSPRPQRTVLLIDEIDKSDSEFEAFLLEVLSDFTVSVPELGTLRANAHPDRAADQQQRARDVGRAQAPLPAPVHRLPVAASRSSRSCASRCPASAQRWRRRWSRPSSACASSISRRCRASARRSTGRKTLTLLNAKRARRDAGRGHAERDPQVRGRHAQGAGRAQGLPADSARGGGRRRATTRTACR